MRESEQERKKNVMVETDTHTHTLEFNAVSSLSWLDSTSAAAKLLCVIGALRLRVYDVLLVQPDNMLVLITRVRKGGREGVEVSK